MKSTISVAIALSLTIAACGGRQPQPQMIVKNKVVAASPEQAFDAVLAVFGEYNWPIKTIDRHSGLIASDWMQVSRDPGYSDCGDDRSDRRAGRLTVMIIDNDGLTTVRVNAIFRNVHRNAYDEWYGTCVTTGGIEAVIHKDVVDHLRRTGTTASPTPTR